MMSLGKMSAGMRKVATGGFDEIGWVKILHGRAPLALQEFQTAHCLTADCHLTVHHESAADLPWAMDVLELLITQQGERTPRPATPTRCTG